ncbi:MAG: Stp1/IreP family PP2C-type Ser/Thr phosphatase, partial [Solirubrobacteraceae bacterium]
MLRVAEHFERTDTGRQRRGNEDAFYARAPLFAVADGMGGAQAGEVASHLAVEVLEQGLPDGAGSVEERLRARVSEANERIMESAQADDARAGMGTTLTVAYVGEDDLTVAHVGDSRLYRLRDGTFERLTDDHSLVEELVRQGKLTPEEADEHPQRSIITRALGAEEGVEADSATWAGRHDDVYLICSDGLTSMIHEARVAEVLTAAPSLAAAGRSRIDAANDAGGRDNITVVLFRLEEVAASAPATQA